MNSFLNSSVFKRVLSNGDIVDRNWLVYSPTKTRVFCFSCLLFSSDRSQLSGTGFIARFLMFINISNHTGKNLADTLLQFLSNKDIGFNNCRGQTYDNASNISGTQQIMKNKNSLVDYILCAAHSLNLVGQSAVDCCIEAVSFFDILNPLYTFFVTSTYRWDVMMTNV